MKAYKSLESNYFKKKFFLRTSGTYDRVLSNILSAPSMDGPRGYTRHRILCPFYRISLSCRLGLFRASCCSPVAAHSARVSPYECSAQVSVWRKCTWHSIEMTPTWRVEAGRLVFRDLLRATKCAPQYRAFGFAESKFARALSAPATNYVVLRLWTWCARISLPRPSTGCSRSLAAAFSRYFGCG